LQVITVSNYATYEVLEGKTRCRSVLFSTTIDDSVGSSSNGRSHNV